MIKLDVTQDIFWLLKSPKSEIFISSAVSPSSSTSAQYMGFSVLRQGPAKI